jgi:plasmid stability protein
MRITVDLPDSLCRELQARAAHEGRTVEDVMRSLLWHALAEQAPQSAASARSLPPAESAGEPMPLADPTNAGLFELLDDDR